MEGQHGSLHEYENHYPNVDDLLCPVGMENPTCTLKAFPQENMFIVEVRVQDRAELFEFTSESYSRLELENPQVYAILSKMLSRILARQLSWARRF